MLKSGWRFRRLPRPDQALLIKMMTMSCADLLDEWFESPPLKALLGPTGTIGTYGSPRTPGTAFVFLHYALGEVDGVRGAWAFVRGGMGRISEALAAAARARGAIVRVDAAIERILVRDGRARGVVLAGGEEIAGRVVVSNADPKRTFLGLVGRAHLPEEFARGIESIRCRGNSAKINLALGELPDFTALPGDGEHLRGGINIVGADPDHLERAFDDYRAGRPSRGPFLEITIPSTVDKTLAPAGRHVMGISMKFVPYALADGDWESRREALGDLAIDTLAAHAPNIRRAVVHRQVLTPRDFEDRFGLTGGNICHGEMAPDQLFVMRPIYGWARHRTPIDGLYLCGSGAHPGGGVIGTAGRNAGRAVLHDLRRARSR
jgi:phytoene dehydrogenase-like protein